MDLSEAAKELGRRLCGVVPHVVATGESYDAQGVNGLLVSLDVHSMHEIHLAIHGILKEIGGTQFGGHVIHVRLGGTPQFAAEPVLEVS